MEPAVLTSAFGVKVVFKKVLVGLQGKLTLAPPKEAEARALVLEASAALEGNVYMHTLLHDHACMHVSEVQKQ